MSLTVRHLLDPALVVDPGTTLAEAVGLLQRNGVERLFLSAKEPAGPRIVSDFSLLKALVRGEPVDLAVESLAQPIEECLASGATVHEAAIAFRCGHRTVLPVVEAGLVVGIVRRAAVLARLLEERLAAPGTAPVAETVPMPACFTAQAAKTG